MSEIFVGLSVAFRDRDAVGGDRPLEAMDAWSDAAGFPCITSSPPAATAGTTLSIRLLEMADTARGLPTAVPMTGNGSAKNKESVRACSVR